MPVRLDLLPALATRPAQPRVWLWLGMLLMSLLMGPALLLLFATEALRQQPHTLWGLGLGAPLLGWSLLGCTRMLIHIGQQRAADGWDLAREEDLRRKIRRGRRSLQVLGTSQYCTMCQPGEQATEQLDALLSGASFLKTQPAWQGDAAERHSRLLGAGDAPAEIVMLSTLQQVLSDLGQSLANIPADTPLALLLEVDSGLPDNLLSRVWRQAWSTSGIRQSTMLVEGRGLAAVDSWLDQRINDQALLLVVAMQFAPQQPDATAEVAVGLLFGNRLTQTTLSPIAYLHRPEQVSNPGREHFLYAARQALEWVPLPVQAIEQVWVSGIDAHRRPALTTLLNDLEMPVKLGQGLCDLDACLGHSGQASPWLGIAAAAQTVARGAGPQFVFSAGSTVDSRLWSTVLMPVLVPSKQEI